MIDVETLKQSVDCRMLVERDLGKPAYRTHDYSTFKCPFHRERRGCSLVVYATCWRCFGKCAVGGDVIGWLQRVHALSFPQACAQLMAGDLPARAETRLRWRPEPEAHADPPGQAWQKIAGRIAKQAADRLWSREGRRALAYLKAKRGLSEAIIASAQLGFLSGQPTEWKRIGGLAVPCGILIPWYAEGALWGIKVRRAAGEQRYQQVSGGNIRGGLYRADSIQAGLPLLLTEGEFDALTVCQMGGGQLSVVSIGSASYGHIQRRWLGKLLLAPRILVCTDADAAGEKAAAAIATLSSAVKRVQLPMGKDMNDFYRRTSHQAACAWLKRLVDAESSAGAALEG